MNTYKATDKTKLMAFVGERVILTGSIKVGVVTVEKIRILTDKR